MIMNKLFYILLLCNFIAVFGSQEEQKGLVIAPYPNVLKFTLVNEKKTFYCMKYNVDCCQLSIEKDGWRINLNSRQGDIKTKFFEGLTETLKVNNIDTDRNYIAALKKNGRDFLFFAVSSNLMDALDMLE